MMNIGSFLKLVEIQTKVASIIPYLLGTTFALYKFENFNIKNAVTLFMSMLIFDMTTTTINNYMDYKKAIKKHGFGYETHNAIVKDKLNPTLVLFTIVSMFIVSAILGLVLFLRTDIIVLLLGVISFAIGVLYSFGPIPISRTPFGEIFSGFTMGFIITFLAMYIHIFDQNIIGINLVNNTLNLSFNINIIISLLIVTLPAVAGISNIMLANNICDMDDDIVNKRYTLPIYIGKEKALSTFKWVYYIGFLAIVVEVFMKILPVVSLLTLIALKPVSDNIKAFNKLQSKKDTFVLSVKNFVIVNIIYIASILLAIVLK